VVGLAPAGIESRLTTPPTLVVLVEPVVVADVDPADEPDEAPDPPERPDGTEPPVGDADGDGKPVFVGVGVGVGLGVDVEVGEGEGEGLPEASLARGTSPSSGAAVVSTAYVVVTALSPAPPTTATAVPDDRLKVAWVSADALDESLDESLAAPPPSAMDVVPFAELRVKSAWTVCEMVPLVTSDVR
jgi:hypothetical protein